MRKIKFRAWDKKEKKMFVDCMMWGDHGEWRVLDTTIGQTEIMQYTGLHDKNGKEIYEGDILKCKVGLYKIIFKNGAWQGEPLETFKSCYGSLVTSRIYTDVKKKVFEIIGNIYKNPKLIKEAK